MYDMKGDEIMAVSYNLVSCLPRHHFGASLWLKIWRIDEHLNRF